MLSPDSGGRGNKVLTQAIPWVNLENVRLSERTHKRSHVAKMSRTGKSRDRQYISACLRLGWRRQWQPTPVLLPGKSHGQRSLVGCSSWGRKESDTTEWLHFHFSLSCIGERNDNSLQYSCLENPRDSWAWWAAVYGVAQSRTDWSDLAAAAG